MLRPCILWNDTRSWREAAQLDADPRFRKITGNIVFPGFTAPKLAWVKNNEPEIFARVAKVLLPKDYLRFWLTGEHISEMSDSAGTAWLDVGGPRWSPELLAATDLDESQMPALVEGTEPAGMLRRELAAEWGMGGQCRHRRRSRRQCGLGLRHGRGPQWRRLRLDRHLGRAVRGQRRLSAQSAKRRCTPSATPCRSAWHQMGVILSATDSLNWLEKITGKDAGHLTAELGDDAARADAASPSCPIFRASARRTTTPSSAAPSPALATRAAAPN